MAIGDSPVVVGVDGTKKALLAARWAAAVADKFGSPLCIIHAVPDTRYYLSGIADADRSAALARMTESTHEILAEAERAVRADFAALPITSTTVVQPPDETASETLVHVSRRARLFVIGCDEVGPAGALLVQSETLALAAHSACPVVAWRGEAIRPNDRPIVAGIDGTGACALPVAFEFAHLFEVPLIAVHAWSSRRPPGDVTVPFLIGWNKIEREHERSVADALAPWRQRYPDVDVTSVVAATKPSRLLMHRAGDAQLVVIGRGRRGPVASALLGSTSLNLLHHSPAAVMISPPSG